MMGAWQRPAVPQVSGHVTWTLGPLMRSTRWVGPSAGRVLTSGSPGPGRAYRSRETISAGKDLPRTHLSHPPGRVSGRDRGQCQRAVALSLGW